MTAPQRSDTRPVDDRAGITAPWVDWSHVHAFVDKAWDPENIPHHSIIGLTGSGKSYLAINGLLRPMCKLDRVLILDTKQDDKLVSSIGHPVEELPQKTWISGRRKDQPFDNWFRLVVKDPVRDRVAAQTQVRKALDTVYREGNWVVYIDELIDVAGRESPNLGLMPYVDAIYRKGRSKHISLVAGTQAPRFVPTSFYDQAGFAWIGRIRDKERQKRLLEIGGLSTAELPFIAQLQRRQWLLAADNGETFMRSTVTATGISEEVSK